VLYGLLAEGGLENKKNVQMSASDKDLEPVFRKLCSFATFNIFNLSSRFGDVPWFYTDEEASQILMGHQVLREENYLEAIFGQLSIQKNDAWLAKHTEVEVAWLFDASQIRRMLLEVASIENKHSNPTEPKLTRRKSFA